MPQRPERVQIGNLSLGQSISAQYNPEEIEEQLDAIYKDIEVQGLSHDILQYDHTKSLALSFTLGFDRMSTDKTDVDYSRNFLHALFYPTRQATSVKSGAPPKTLMVWPGLYRLTGVMRKLKIRHRHFAFSMATVRFVAELGFTETRIERIYSEDVLRQGTQR